LDPRLVAALTGVDVILHAGDVGSSAVLEALVAIAPVHAVRGNNDREAYAAELPEHLDLELSGLPLHLVHELPAARPLAATRAIVFGHSHRQIYEQRDGVLFLNPGAAGRAGFHRLQTAALMHIAAGEASVRLLELGPRLPLPRPARTPRKLGAGLEIG
jgi:putative phosphoesterase